jgi:ribonuclease H / adenosylcobalamin/alpha-ribazole phosphatase
MRAHPHPDGRLGPVTDTSSRRRLVIEADGGSRGNPGRAAYGAVVKDAATGDVLAERAETIGIASNNVAEYRGLIAGLAAAREIDPEAQVEARMDSKLVVEQMSGRWQVKHPDMKVLAKEAFAAFPPDQVTYTWVPRADNRHADQLVNDALDGLTSAGVPAREAIPADTGNPTVTVLLRHGETPLTRERRFSGTGGSDPSLTDSGRTQAGAAGRALADAGHTSLVVVTSPLLRTRETAEIVAEALGSGPVVVDNDLRELNYGEWDGFSFAEVRERWPAEHAAFMRSTRAVPPGGESLDAVAARVERARTRLLETYARRTIVVVTHVTPIKVLVTRALSVPLEAVHRMELGPASLTTLAWWTDGNASLRTYNHQPPLG